MKYLLSLAVVALVAVVVLQWRTWPPEPGSEGASADERQAESANPPDPGPLELIEAPVAKEEYRVITERPLFLPGRRPPADEPEEEAEAPEEAPKTDLASMDLSAVVITPVEATAWVRTGSDLVKLRLGDDLEGWSVKAISPDEIELERQGETDKLILRDYQKSPPPVAVRKPRAGARRPVRPPVAGARRPRQTPRARPPVTQPRPGVRQPRTRTNAQRSRQP